MDIPTQTYDSFVIGSDQIKMGTKVQMFETNISSHHEMALLPKIKHKKQHIKR